MKAQPQKPRQDRAIDRSRNERQKSIFLREYSHIHSHRMMENLISIHESMNKVVQNMIKCLERIAKRP